MADHTAPYGGSRKSNGPLVRGTAKEAGVAGGVVGNRREPIVKNIFTVSEKASHGGL